METLIIAKGDKKMELFFNMAQELFEMFTSPVVIITGILILAPAIIIKKIIN